MAVNIPSLANALMALSTGTLGQVQVQLRAARDALQSQILARNNAVPPMDTTALSTQFSLVNTWIRALDAAVQPSPPSSAAADLLSAMRAVDHATANSAALDHLLVTIDGIVQTA